jgi:hypothetical protein
VLELLGYRRLVVETLLDATMMLLFGQHHHDALLRMNARAFDSRIVDLRKALHQTPLTSHNHLREKSLSALTESRGLQRGLIVPMCVTLGTRGEHDDGHAGEAEGDAE